MRILTYLRNKNKEVLTMEKELFVRAEEVARELGVSKPYAYKLVREMNEELKKKGFLTIPGRVSTVFFPKSIADSYSSGFGKRFRKAIS